MLKKRRIVRWEPYEQEEKSQPEGQEVGWGQDMWSYRPGKQSLLISFLNIVEPLHNFKQGSNVI